MKRLFLVCVAGAVMLACNNSATTAVTDPLADTTGVLVDSADVYDTAIDIPAADTVLLGFYNGLLPCKDCQGIRHTLLLKNTGLFRLEEFVLGKNIFPEKRQGRWIRNGDSLRLMSNQKALATYYIKGDTLQLAHFDGRPMPDSIGKNYWIARIPGAAANPAWKKKKAAGTDFYAIGTEPFWSLEIDNDRGVSFKLADLPKPVTFSISQPTTGKDSTVYSLDNAGSKLEITIYNEFCNDGMSDNLYEQRVHVRYKGETFKGCGVYLNVE
jgi:uncharacterized membrane protein